MSNFDSPEAHALLAKGWARVGQSFRDPNTGALLSTEEATAIAAKRKEPASKPNLWGRNASREGAAIRRANH